MPYQVTDKPRVLIYTSGLLLMGITMQPVQAEVSAKFGVNAFYTDDVALFSVTRRLSLKEDPTQPSVDRPEQGNDFVYEPNAELEWTHENDWGRMSIALDAGGYLFQQQTAFTHGLYELQIAQTFATGSKVSLLYNVVPDLYLGKNEFRRLNGEESEHDEKLSNHYWSIHFDQPLTDSLTFRLLGRYGLRNYNEPFQHRDTRFWTLGPHLEWEINQDIELLMGYHYERGRADQWKAAHFPDDVSYINHYASAELKFRLLEPLSAVFIIDYEKNDFTSDNPVDEHYGAVESVYQGEFELLYELAENTELKLGWQYGSRTLTGEERSIKNNNVWLGVDYGF